LMTSTTLRTCRWRSGTIPGLQHGSISGARPQSTRAERRPDGP